MARKKRKPTKPKNDPVAKFLRPTPEREAHNDFRSAGAAVVVVPPIAALHKSGILTDEEFSALAYYRDQANLADKSPMRSCCDDTVRGGGRGPSMAILSAIREVKHIDSGLGPYLASMLRSIVRDDMTLEVWALAEWGSVKGSNPPAPHPDKVSMTVLELKYAAGGINPYRS